MNEFESIDRLTVNTPNLCPVCGTEMKIRETGEMFGPAVVVEDYCPKCGDDE